MSSRENTPPHPLLKLSEKDELSIIPVLSNDDSDVEEDIEVLSEDLRLRIFCDTIAHEISTSVDVDPLCGMVRKADVMTIPESKIEVVADKTSKKLDNIITGIIDDGKLQDQKPVAAGTSNRRERRKSNAKQTEKKSEHAEHSVSKSIRGKSVLEAHKYEKQDYFDADMDLGDKIDTSLLLYTNIIMKLYTIDKGLDFVLDRFNEHTRYCLLFEALHTFDNEIQYIYDKFQEDINKIFKSDASIDGSAPCASISLNVKQSNVPAIGYENICGRYTNISRRMKERIIEYSTLYKNLSSSLRIYNLSSENARLTALLVNADKYRGFCSARIMKILSILNLFKEIVDRRIQDCNRITSNLFELAKSASNDAEHKDMLKHLYSSLDVIVKIRRKKQNYLEDWKYMEKKKEEMIKQSHFLEFWGAVSSHMCNRDPNYIMAKTNSLIELNFEIFDSLRKILSDVGWILTLTNSLAPQT